MERMGKRVETVERCMQVRGGRGGGETSGEIRLKTWLLSGAVLKLARWLVVVMVVVVAAERGIFQVKLSDALPFHIRWNIARGDPAGR